MKFLGDGALVVWSLPNGTDAQAEFLINLASRLFIARQTFPDSAHAFAEQFGLLELPHQVRFGVAAGEILRLSVEGPGDEYVGFPINLSSRLQAYCRSLGFIISGRTGMSRSTIKELGFRRVVAKELKGFESEIVLVDSLDYEALGSDERDALFSEVGE